MEGLEMICFQIISGVGAARSSYIEAIQKAKAGDFEGAEACMEAGQQEFLKGHEAHFELIQKEAQGVQVGGSLILVHAAHQGWISEMEQVRLFDRLKIQIAA